MKQHPFGQTYKIFSHLQSNPGVDIPALDLHKIASGHEYGFCASLSRRISDCRALGMNVIVSRDEYVDGQRQTWYRYVPRNKVQDEPKEIVLSPHVKVLLNHDGPTVVMTGGGGGGGSHYVECIPHPVTVALSEKLYVDDDICEFDEHS
jgi:hypothetical protein